MTRILAAAGAVVSGAFADAQRNDHSRVAHHRHTARHTRAARSAVWWAAAAVALMLMLLGAADGILYEALTAPQERGIMDRPY